MNKIFIKAIFALLLVSSFSSAFGYEIKGKVNGVKSGKAILLVSQPEKFAFTDTTNMVDGKFSFKGNVPEAMYAAVIIAPDGEESASMGIILENTNITIDEDWKNVDSRYGQRYFTKTNYKGGINGTVSTRYNNQYDSISSQPKYAAYKKAWKDLEALRDTDPAAYKVKYDVVKAETEKDREAMSEESKQASIKLIKGNSNVEYSAFVLRMLTSGLSLEELEGLFNTLTPKVQNSHFAEDVREEIKNLKAVAPGQPAPDFTLKTPSGTLFTLSSLKGKYVLVDFWASWCGPCRAAVPELKELYAKYKEKGLEIVGVTNDSREKDWLKAIEVDQTPWIHVIDEFPIKNKPSKVGTLYGTHYLPSYFLVDPNGKMIGKFDKPELKEKLKEIFR